MALSGSQKLAAGGWVTSASGMHTTTSAEIIQNTLAKLKTERQLVTLAHKGYMSGKTVILEYNTRQLQIDKPLDWPGTQTQLRILFKDAEKLWNQFLVKVLEVKGNQLVTSFPAELSRLQRRANYRVKVPRGSLVDFTHQEVFYEELVVRDISANGALFCSERKIALPEGSVISDIAMTFPSSGFDDAYVNIRTGRVRRVFKDEARRVCFGVQFELTRNEEDALLQYVRQRERELLRRGLT